MSRRTRWLNAKKRFNSRASMTLYRRRSDVGPDHFVIMHKESDGRELAIGFIHNPTRTNLTTLGAWEWNIEHHQRAGRSLPQWGTCETPPLLGRTPARANLIAGGRALRLRLLCKSENYSSRCGSSALAKVSRALSFRNEGGGSYEEISRSWSCCSLVAQRRRLWPLWQSALWQSACCCQCANNRFRKGVG